MIGKARERLADALLYHTCGTIFRFQIVMAGLDPAILVGTVLRQMAGSSPAMT
jgi:hypothetical protein